MAQGFLSGAIWGAVFSGVGVAAISLNSPLPERVVIVPPPVGAVDSSLLDDTPDGPPAGEVVTPEPEAPDLSKPRVVETPESDPIAKPDLSKPGLRPQPETGVDRLAAPSGAPAAPADPVIAGDITTPPAAPRVGVAPDAPEGGEPDSSDTPRVGMLDAPELPAVQGTAPGAPRPEAQPIIVTGPAQPPAPVVPDADSALLPDSPAVDPTPEVSAVDPAPKASDPVPEVVIPAPETNSLTRSVPTPSAPTVGKPATSLFSRTPEVLPDAVPQETASADRAKALAALPADSPLVQFSAAGKVPDDVPRMAVVLVDDGSGPLGPDGLRAFPFPISFAISPSHPDAAGVAKAYRDLGFEVLVLGSMPEGARASDVEIAMEGLIAAIPGAVAVLEDPEGTLQDNREMSSQVAAFLGGSGHGLIMQPNGLDTAQKLALKDGVPSVTLFRDFDGEAQDASVIRRTLDQAAFRARQEGGVVMMGRLRADTISALVLWGLQDRSDTIALVPASVVLAESLAQ